MSLLKKIKSILKAQSSLEYLMIAAAILVIAVVVVAVANSMTGSVDSQNTVTQEKYVAGIKGIKLIDYTQQYVGNSQTAPSAIVKSGKELNVVVLTSTTPITEGTLIKASKFHELGINPSSKKKFPVFEDGTQAILPDQAVMDFMDEYKIGSLSDFLDLDNNPSFIENVNENSATVKSSCNGNMKLADITAPATGLLTYSELDSNALTIASLIEVAETKAADNIVTIRNCGMPAPAPPTDCPSIVDLNLVSKTASVLLAESNHGLNCYPTGNILFNINIGHTSGSQDTSTDYLRLYAHHTDLSTSIVQYDRCNIAGEDIPCNPANLPVISSSSPVNETYELFNLTSDAPIDYFEYKWVAWHRDGEHIYYGGSVDTTPQPPVVNAYCSDCEVNQPCWYNASAYDMDGTVVNYSWSFSNGNYSFSPFGVQYYSTPGTHVANVTVWDDGGESTTAFCTFNVSQPAPQMIPIDDLHVTNVTDTSVYSAWTPQWNSSFDFYRINKRELGETWQWVADVLDQSTDSFQFTGLSPGITYEFRVLNFYNSVYNSSNIVNGTTVETVTPTPSPTAQPNQPPVAVADCPKHCSLNQSCWFLGNQSYDPDSGDTINGYHWNFDDGNGGDGYMVNHIYYGSPMNYTVELLVWNDMNATDSCIVAVS